MKKMYVSQCTTYPQKCADIFLYLGSNFPRVKAKILIVEDQFIEGNNLRRILTAAGYAVTGIAFSVPDALRSIENDRPDMVMLDIYLEGKLTGIDLAWLLKRKNIGFIFLSANSDRKNLDAAKATKPCGFLVKPFRQQDVLVMLEVALYVHGEQRAMDGKEAAAPAECDPGKCFTQLIGDSPAMRDVCEGIKVVAPSALSVLLTGESGTGKELVAKCIHELSDRRAGPLVVVNCGALPSNLIESELFGHEKGAFTGATDKRIGKFEQAEGGVIFLDEIGELPMDMQVKFLRVLQERQIEPVGGKTRSVNVRVIAATNRDLEEEMAQGRFRLDLYYRLNVFPINIPPLRERKADIPPLARHFLTLYAEKEKKGRRELSDAAIKCLMEYSWPGNIRELENLMARTALLSKTGIVDSVQLPSAKTLSGAVNPGTETMTDIERNHILSILVKCNWKITGDGGASEVLKMNGSTLRSRMKKLNINKQTYLGTG